MKKIRPLGHILLDLEPLWEEMIDDHGLQISDVIGLSVVWAQVHRPDSKEVFVQDDTSPGLLIDGDKVVYASKEELIKYLTRRES